MTEELSTANIKKASAKDLEKILILQKQEFVAEAQLYNDYTIPPLHQTLADFLEEFNKGIVLKMEISGQIVGSVRAYEENKTCYIGKLIVDSAFQNRGIGQNLMKSVEQFFPDCKRFELFTGYKSEKNIHLYKKLGYKELKQIQIREDVILIVMEKVKPFILTT